MKNLVALVGKPNVGKSTLFNRLIGKRQAIVYDQPGVTRDRLYEKAQWSGQDFTIIDTGGITDAKQPLLAAIRMQAEIAIAEAQVIIIVVDGRYEMTTEDHLVIDLIRKSGKPFLLAANKLEANKMFDYSLYNLGIAPIYAISALHSEGVGQLLDAVLTHFQPTKVIEQPSFKIALIGKPNAGKSSLLNQLVNQQRAIVSDLPGTTRDTINAQFYLDEDLLEIIDTAGIRRKSRLVEAVEHYALMRAMAALEASQLSLLIIDATQELSHFDARIAGYAMEVKKPIILVVNKWDLITKTTKTINEFTKQIQQQFKFLNWAPIVFLSAKTGLRLHKLKEVILQVKSNLKQEFKTTALNQMILEIQQMQPAPSFKGRRLIIHYAKQITGPIPTFVLQVNDRAYLHFSYQRYIENQFRNYFDFTGVPINLIFRTQETKKSK